MMKRRAIAIALLALGAVCLGVAHAEIVNDFPEVVILGESSAQIDQNVTVVSGDLVTNAAGGTMSLGNKVTTPLGWQVKADSLSVGNFVNLFGTELCNFPSGGVSCAPLAVPVYGTLPVFQPTSGGGNPVIVPNSGSTVLAPNNYGALTVGVEGTVTFAGPGEFNFTSFTAGRKGQFVFTGGPVEIRVSGNFSSGVEDNFNLAQSPVAASDIVIYVGGSAEIGDKSNLNVNFYVQGLLEIGSNVIANGAYLAGQMDIGQKSRFALSTFWDYTPVAAADEATTDEDTSVVIGVLGNDTDQDGDDLFVADIIQGQEPDNGTVACSAGGTFPCAVDDTLTYTPDPDYFGSDSFTYQVCDVDTQINEDNCDEAVVDITIVSVNDPPIPGADSATTPEDPDDPIDIDVLANDVVGPPGPPAETGSLTITAVSEPANGRAIIIGIAPGQTITYTPDRDYFGDDTFTYTVCDDGDGFDDPESRCATGTVTVTVTPVNDPPIADEQTVLTAGVDPIDIVLTGSDVEGDFLTFTIVSGPGAGTITAGPSQIDGGSASVSYDAATEGDPDSFTFQVDDGNGGTATAVVSINPADDPQPETDIVASDQGVETGVDTPVEVTLSAFAPDSIGDLQFNVVSGPSSGALSAITNVAETPVRNATTTYTPASLFEGTDSFTFEACDAADPGNCDEATVSIGVQPAATAEPPVALDQTVTTGVDGSVTINLVSPENTEEDPEGRTCTDNADCASGFICDDGSCVPGP